MNFSTQPNLSQPVNTLGVRIAKLKRRIAGRMEQGFYSEFKGFGLRRDLAKAHEKPKAKIPIFVRPLLEKDLDIVLPMDGDISPADQQQITWRRHFYSKVPHSCYVAVDKRNDTPCYIQWLIGAHENPLLSRFKCFPELANDEALLEQAFTTPSHRGLGIMSEAMSEIAEQAKNLEARYVLTFVEEGGIASLKACHRAGFSPHLLHRRTQLGYGVIVNNSFRKMADNDPRRNPAY